MKHRSKENGQQNDHWETPDYVHDYLRYWYFTGPPFDPYPLYPLVDGLNIPWNEENYINPPYNRSDKADRYS